MSITLTGVIIHKTPAVVNHRCLYLLYTVTIQTLAAALDAALRLRIWLMTDFRWIYEKQPDQ